MSIISISSTQVLEYFFPLGEARGFPLNCTHVPLRGEFCLKFRKPLQKREASPMEQFLTLYKIFRKDGYIIDDSGRSARRGWQPEDNIPGGKP